MAKEKVIALARGHDGRQLREAGEEFDIEVDKDATWYTPVRAEVKPDDAPRRGRPPKAKEPDSEDIA